MTTEWVAAAGTERVELARSGSAEKPGPSIGELTFTITNPGPVEDRAVFEIVPGDGAKKAWFTVDEPQRRVPAGQSVTYLIKVSVPVEEPAGPFWIQGRVYSADTAPEESSRLSGRVSGDVTAAEVKPGKPWWLLAVAGLLVVVIGVVGWLVLRPNNPPEVTVPELAGQTEDEARTVLAGAGLQLGTVSRRHRSVGDRTVIRQSAAAGSTVATSTMIDLEIAIQLGVPTLTAPVTGTVLQAGAEPPILEWTAVPDAVAYNVRQEFRRCLISRQGRFCDYVLSSNANVTGATSWDPEVADPKPIFEFGEIRWQVTALDDFKDPGPSSLFFSYTIPGN